MSQFYVIVSNMHGLALDVEGSNTNPGTRVLPWQKHGKDNQQFYDDPSTGTIRSKINNLCIDVEANGLVLKPFQAGDPNQQWERRGNQIANRFNQGEVLEIAGNDRNQGARVQKYQYNGGQNQLWTFEYVGGQPPQPGYPSFQASTYPGAQPAYPGGQTGYPGYPQQGQQTYPAYPAGGAQQQPRQEFFIVSEMHGKVLDIKAASKDPGAQVIMWGKNPQVSKNQRWYLDGQGFIRSALNDLAFRAERGHALKMDKTNDARSQWRFDGNKVVNGAGDVLDISRDNKDDGAEVIAYSHHGKSNQRFRKELA